MMNFKLLKEPFPAHDIEWRIQQSGKSGEKVWAMVLAYVTNRAIMNRLDDVCEPQNWCNQYETGPDGGILCGLSIKCGDEWVTKWDGAENTQVEAVKGGLSNAMKRAGSQWGIGRYLYNLPATFAKCSSDPKLYENRGRLKDDTQFSWETPTLPHWALPEDTNPLSPNNPDEPPNSDPKPLLKAQGEAILKIAAEKSNLTEDDARTVIDWYCLENGRTYHSGKELITEWDKIYERFLDHLEKCGSEIKS